MSGNIDPSRNRDLARIHMLKKQLQDSHGIDDGDYRRLLLQVCGASSSSELNKLARLKFIAHLEKCLGASKKTRTFTKLPPKQAKIYSLWQQLFTAKRVEDKRFSALEAWCKAQTGVDKLQWLNEAQAAQCIESLKRWLARK
jgi:Protein of unknown function (DUF1018)